MKSDPKDAPKADEPKPKRGDGRRGKGAGWGGPAKGSGNGSERQAFGDETNAQGHSKATPISEGNRRALRSEQAESMKDLLVTIATDVGQPGAVRVAAADKFIDRIEGKAVQKQVVKLDINPDDMTDAEIIAAIRAEEDEQIH